MIRLEAVSKTFAEGAAPAVDRVDLDVPEGMTVALIGPSGCGKTTTLRMINRLIEPSSGRIFVAGEDVTSGDPVQLRRRIGYVIQQVGLFPHMTVAQNIATVPRLLGWTRARTEERVDAMLHLVGLDPAAMRDRRPRQLSGGQRQRIGVARALAADPPVMLMDEPFGAIDPIARGRLQDEFKAILRRVKKTVVMVTHDMEEAIRMGDRVAIMRDGRLVQYDTPEAVLAQPADPFVDAFLGGDRGLRRLGLATVEAVMVAASGAEGPSVRAGTSLREALSAMLVGRTEVVLVRDDGGAVIGEVRRGAVLAY